MDCQAEVVISAMNDDLMPSSLAVRSHGVNVRRPRPQRTICRQGGGESGNTPVILGFPAIFKVWGESTRPTETLRRLNLENGFTRE